MIGTFGPVTFKVSEKQIRTFDNFSRSNSARWSVHDIHLQHPITEFLGEGQDSISFTMQFDVHFGVVPRREIAVLLRMSRKGQAETLIVGNSAVGVNKWYIESVKENWGRVDNRGKVLSGSADVTLKAYV